MNAQSISQILDALAAKLRVPASHLWAVLIRQAVIDFWTTAATAMFLWAVALVVFKFFLKFYRREKKDFFDEGPEIPLGVLTIFLGVGALIVTLVLVNSIGQLINPEYYALREVLKVLK